MKTKLTAILIALTTSFALAHEGVELGPNKGRIIEFSTDESMHGEVTEKDGKLNIALLDKDMKLVKVEAQSLTATAGTREKPLKIETTATDGGFTLATPGVDEWLILQYKSTPEAKPITARLHFITKTCPPCGNPEWRCACGEKK
ncbi:hypothetical protein HQ447_09305 [bacterium]|nr:hypothetical protein [bacterium]